MINNGVSRNKWNKFSRWKF